MSLVIKPSLTVNTGSMFSGKTSELLKQGKIYEMVGAKVLYIKPDLDNRYDNTKIVAHNGESVEAKVIAPNVDLLRIPEVREADVILIDEVQFFDYTTSIYISLLVSEYDKVVCVSGLDLDFRGMTFAVTEKLMGYADVINKFKAICAKCGAPAYISARKTSDTEVIKVGGADEYEPLCRECYKNKKENNYREVN